jgi:cytochrome oxidase Cu insertion factor (SCO1/SenC/PrrC family)
MTSHLETREDAYRDAMTTGRIKLLLIFLVCASPVVASYVTYYFFRPDGRVNYGTLIEPVKPLPDMTLALLDGTPFRSADFKGKWTLLTFDGGDCAAECTDKLFKMRQLRTMQGKERDRVERAWVITDQAQLSTQLMREYDGMKMLRAGDAPLDSAFPATGARSEHIYLIDPLGNLVLRYPKGADPMKMSRDLARLLKYSRVG